MAGEDSTSLQEILASLIIVCLIVSLTISTQMMEFFSVNLRREHEQAVSYGSIRLFGSLGGLASTLLVSSFAYQHHHHRSQVLDRKATLATILLTPVMAILFGAASLVMVCLWPDERPFATNQQTDDSSNVSQHHHEDEGTKFDFTQSVWSLKNAENECKLESRLVDILIDPTQPIRILGANINYHFDTREEDAYRNIRRCSLAPLGDSFLVKQFELDHKNVRHFNFVTNVQPLASASIDDIPTIDYLPNNNGRRSSSGIQMNWLAGESRIKMMNPLDLAARLSPATTTTTTTTTDHLSAKTQFGLFMDLASRNGSFVRFFCYLIATGVIRALTNSYPYFRAARRLELGIVSMDSERFVAPTLGYLSEIAFYYNANRSSWLQSSLSRESSLIFILLTHVLLHSIRTIFVDLVANQQDGVEVWLSLMVTIIDGSVCGAWLNCLLVESAMEFANETRFSLAALMRSSPTTTAMRRACADDAVAAAGKDRRVRNGLKATMVCLLFSSLNGIGHTIGSIVACTLSEIGYGAGTVCLLSISLALAMALTLISSQRYRI